MGNRWLHIFTATCLGSAAATAMDEAAATTSFEIIVSVAEQKLALVKDGAVVRKYPVSTSKFGLGDSNGSYKTPLGRLRVCDKIGDSLPLGAVLKSRHATGEILPANSPGRDPIVTRILWLDGLEPGNAGAKGRGIYIHGTVEEGKLGKPVSYGCIRMRSRDVVELFDDTPTGAQVQIISEKFPHLLKAPKPEVLLASNRGASGAAKAGSTMEVPADEKSKPAGAPAQLVAAKPAGASKGVKPAAQALAKATPLEAEIGPVVVFATQKVLPKAAAPEPRVVFAMTSSILFSDLRELPKPAASVPTPAREQQPLEPAEASPRAVRIQVAEPIDLFTSAARREMPLDQLSAWLLEPPTPPLRLAFRASTPPGAPDL